MGGITRQARIEAKGRRARSTPRTGWDSSSDVLIATAERLFAQRGIDAVSMREIAREAGQRNNSALHYHFGSKEALIAAILRRRMQEIDILRNNYLDACISQGRGLELRTAIEAIVWPLASGLAGKASSYTRFLAAAQMHPDVDLAELASDYGERGLKRVYELIKQRLPGLPDALLRQRYLSAISFVIFSLADYERIKTRRNKARASFDVRRAIENLIDMLTGALAAPSARMDANSCPRC
jgi:AcrR family transcriptional regulator